MTIPQSFFEETHLDAPAASARTSSELAEAVAAAEGGEEAA